MAENTKVWPVTARQDSVYQGIRNYFEEHGIAPSLDEIGELAGLRSTWAVRYHLAKLEKKGLLRRVGKNIPRGIELLPARRAA